MQLTGQQVSFREAHEVCARAHCHDRRGAYLSLCGPDRLFACHRACLGACRLSFYHLCRRASDRRGRNRFDPSYRGPDLGHLCASHLYLHHRAYHFSTLGLSSFSVCVEGSFVVSGNESARGLAQVCALLRPLWVTHREVVMAKALSRQV